MKKPKYLEDADSLQYKQNLADLMAMINPKPSKEVLERLRERYIKEREAHENKYSV